MARRLCVALTRMPSLPLLDAKELSTLRAAPAQKRKRALWPVTRPFARGGPLARQLHLGASAIATPGVAERASYSCPDVYLLRTLRDGSART